MMPGVTITISSPVLVAGTMTAVTDSSGVYRFPSLVPGTYNIKIELAGFQTILGQDGWQRAVHTGSHDRDTVLADVVDARLKAPQSCHADVADLRRLMAAERERARCLTGYGRIRRPRRHDDDLTRGPTGRGRPEECGA